MLLDLATADARARVRANRAALAWTARAQTAAAWRDVRPLGCGGSSACRAAIGRRHAAPGRRARAISASVARLVGSGWRCRRRCRRRTTRHSPSGRRRLVRRCRRRADAAASADDRHVGRRRRIAGAVRRLARGDDAIAAVASRDVPEPAIRIAGTPRHGEASDRHASRRRPRGGRRRAAIVERRLGTPGGRDDERRRHRIVHRTEATAAVPTSRRRPRQVASDSLAAPAARRHGHSFATAAGDWRSAASCSARLATVRPAPQDCRDSPSIYPRAGVIVARRCSRAPQRRGCRSTGSGRAARVTRAVTRRRRTRKRMASMPVPDELVVVDHDQHASSPVPMMARCARRKISGEPRRG